MKQYMDPLAVLSDGGESSEDEEEEDFLSSGKKPKMAGPGAVVSSAAASSSSNERPSAVPHPLDYQALSRHGYRSGPSILYVPAPRAAAPTDQSWEWGQGRSAKPGEPCGTGDADGEAETEGESFSERERLRQCANELGEQAAARAIAEREEGQHQRRGGAAERRELQQQQQPSFAQKEKRKRDLGQASRAKSYVEEEKRLLREAGVYSGFDK